MAATSPRSKSRSCWRATSASSSGRCASTPPTTELPAGIHEGRELAVEALRLFGERRVAALLEPRNARALDRLRRALGSARQHHRVLAAVADQRRHPDLLEAGDGGV